jgi:hypothetical protein
MNTKVTTCMPTFIECWYVSNPLRTCALMLEVNVVFANNGEYSTDFYSQFALSSVQPNNSTKAPTARTATNSQTDH